MFSKKEYNISPKILITTKRKLTISSSNKTNNYEKLEFLGDAILNTVVSEYLYVAFSQINEYVVSKRSFIVVGTI